NTSAGTAKMPPPAPVSPKTVPITRPKSPPISKSMSQVYLSRLPPKLSIMPCSAATQRLASKTFLELSNPPQLHRRKIHRHGKRNVDVVRKQIQGHVGKYFDDLLVVEARVAHGLHVGIAHLPARLD